MAGENNGSSPAPGISAPSPPPAGRLTGVFPVALPVTPPILGTPPEVPASPRDRGTARPPLLVPSPRRIPGGQQPPEPHGHLQRTRCPRIVDQTPPGCAHDAHGASTILQPGRPGSDRRVTLVPSAAPASHPPTTPPPFPRLREAFQASRWGRGSRGGEEESRKGYFLTLHILQVEHFVQFSLACKTVSGPSAGAQEPTAAWDNTTGQPEAEKPRVGSPRPLPTFPSGGLAPQVLGEHRMDPGP